jgi:hyaluronan synthase
MLTTATLSKPKQRRRRHYRHAHRDDALLKVGDTRMRARTVDVSPAGACIEIDRNQRLEVGSVIQLDMGIPSAIKTEAPTKRVEISAKVIRMGSSTAASQRYAIRFERSIKEQLAFQKRSTNRLVIAALIFSVIVAIALVKVHNVVNFWYEPWLSLYSLGAVIFFGSRAFLSFFYKEPPDEDFYPTLSIVIAAKNEEDHIAETVDHCFSVNYPPDLIEVFAVDDGSDDNTWAVMQGLLDKYPGLTIHRFEKNLGKRHAMALGAEKARGQFIVYVDSDSYIDPDSLYKIVQPFKDKNIGAVSGHVLVAVEPDNFISKMEAVRYYISHRIMKAAESVFGAVTCCPGAFSAYRRSAVVKILPKWINQTFMGTAATFGDDRSLTNFILRDYQVIYHAGAHCLTYVPRTLKQFFRQQLRWKKSWSRETTVAVRIMWKKHPIAAFFYYVGVVITLISPLVALRSLVYLPLFLSASAIPYVLGIFLVYLVLCLLCLYDTHSPYWYYGLAFAALYLVALSFQNYYAIATVRRNHWGTR